MYEPNTGLQAKSSHRTNTYIAMTVGTLLLLGEYAPAVEVLGLSNSKATAVNVTVNMK